MIPITLLIVNNHTSEKALHNIRQAVQDSGQVEEVHDKTTLPEDLSDRVHTFSGIILTGGPGSVGDDTSYSRQSTLVLKAAEQKIPVFAICYGFQIVAKTFGYDVEHLEPYLEHFDQRYIRGDFPVIVTDPRRLFSKRGEFTAPKDHVYGVLSHQTGPLIHHAYARLHFGIDVVEAVSHPDLPISATQYHAENAPKNSPAFEPFRQFLLSTRKQ